MTPFYRAWEAYRDSNERDSFDPATLGTTAPGTYLENRLHRAFSAGWRSANEDGETDRCVCCGADCSFLAAMELPLGKVCLDCQAKLQGVDVENLMSCEHPTEHLERRCSKCSALIGFVEAANGQCTELRPYENSPGIWQQWCQLKAGHDGAHKWPPQRNSNVA